MIMVFKLNFNLLMPLMLVYVYNVFLTSFYDGSRKYDLKWFSEKNDSKSVLLEHWFHSYIQNMFKIP